MNCLDGTLTRVGGGSADITPSLPVSVAVERVGGAVMTISPSSVFAADMGRFPCAGEMGRVGSSAMSLDGTGGSEGNLMPVGGMSAAMERSGMSSLWMERDGGSSCASIRLAGMTFRIEQVCSVNVTVPYLEISPTIVWVLDGWTSNEVYSNTTWNID